MACNTEQEETINPKEEWKKYRGTVVAYVSKIDFSSGAGYAEYTGVLEYIDDKLAKFRFSTWIEPVFQNRKFGRTNRTLLLEDILYLTPCHDDVKKQQAEFRSSTKLRDLEDDT